MSMSVPPVGGTPVQLQPRVAPSHGFAAAQAAVVEVPTVVAREIGLAARRYEELQAQGRELRFRVSEDREVVVDVCDLEGRILQTIPSEAALDVIHGAPLP